MWLLLTIIAGFLTTAQMLLSRHILKKGSDAWAYSFWYSFIGAVICLPLVFIAPTFPQQIHPWILVAIVSVLIVAHNLLVFKAMNHIEASIGGALSKFRLIWVFLLGIFVLQEAFTWYKLMGVICTLLAGFVVVGKYKQPKKMTAILFILLSTVINATIIILYKILFQSFNVITTTFLIFFIPAIFNLLIMPNAYARVAAILKKDGKFVLLSTVLSGFANLTINQAFLLGEVSRVTVLSEVFLLVILLLEHIFLRERTHLAMKLIAVVLAVVGAILMV